MPSMNTLALPATAAPAQAQPAPARSAALPFRIAAGAVLTLREGRDLRIEVIEGRLWVTSVGDTEDHFIGPGACHALGRARTVVIENVGREPALLRLGRG
jgi:hypothetical protein